MIQGVDGLAGEKDRIAGGLGELLAAGRDVDGVADHRFGGGSEGAFGDIVETVRIDGIRASSATTDEILDP